METLLKQLRELPARFQSLPGGVRATLLGGLVLAVGLALSVGVLTRTGEYQYAFTNLSQEDSTEAAGQLKTAGIPFRLEAGGSALSVPADKVYDARIILATAGLPRGAGVGFEIFDRGDLGVSEFTQRVNLRRATEGELARTIGKFAGVRSARVTVSLGERGLYREEDKKPSASVVAMLQPNRTLGERELKGIRHLVSSAVPGLSPDEVTVMDGNGAVHSTDSAWDSPEASYQRQLETDYEKRIVTLLTPVVGQGAVVARVTASMDSSTVHQNAEVFDPDQVAVLSERELTQSSSNQSNQQAGVAGAQANVPLQPPPAAAGPTAQGTSNNADKVKNYGVSKTNTQTVAKLPRLQKLSVAVVVDGVDGKARAPEEVARLAELARKAVGYDEARGDQFELTSEVFGKSPEVAEVKAPEKTPLWVWIAAGAGVLALLAVAVVLGRRGRKARAPDLVLQPGATVASLEAKAAGSFLEGMAGEQKAMPEEPKPPVLVDPIADVREKARALVRADPGRALYLVRSWLSQDLEKGPEHV